MSFKHRHQCINPHSSTFQVTYKVTAYTGSMEFAGTDETISIAIAGNRDSFTGTKFHSLDKELADDFEKGDTDEYTFEDIDIGLIEFVVVKIEKGLRLSGDPDFYLEKLRVSVGHRIRVPVIVCS